MGALLRFQAKCSGGAECSRGDDESSVRDGKGRYGEGHTSFCGELAKLERGGRGPVLLFLLSLRPSWKHAAEPVMGP